MPTYRYKARDTFNLPAEGLVQAASPELAADILSDQGLTILALEEQGMDLLQRSLGILNRVKAKDLVVLTRQLAVVVSAAIPLVQGLRILQTQIDNATLQGIVSEIADDVEGGSKLSTAMGRHQRVFDNFYISIIRSGETSGKLDEVLNYLADQMEKDYDLSSKIRGAMIYPTFILASMLAVGTLMMIFVVPQMVDILMETGVKLPFTTRLLIAVSNFLSRFWWLLLGLGIGAAIGGPATMRTEQGRRFWDSLRLRIPIFGSLFQKIIIVRLVRSLSTLLIGGVVLSRSLRIVADIVDNVIYHDLIMETVREVEDGNPIASVFLQSKRVPAMVSQMLNLGEKTGRLTDILDKLGNFYSREVDNMVTNLVSLLEPLVMVLMGVAVGLMVSAIILPLYSLANAI